MTFLQHQFFLSNVKVWVILQSVITKLIVVTSWNFIKKKIIDIHWIRMWSYQTDKKGACTEDRTFGMTIFHFSIYMWSRRIPEYQHSEMCKVSSRHSICRWFKALFQLSKTARRIWDLWTCSIKEGVLQKVWICLQIWKQF